MEILAFWKLILSAWYPRLPVATFAHLVGALVQEKKNMLSRRHVDMYDSSSFHSKTEQMQNGAQEWSLPMCFQDK